MINIKNKLINYKIKEKSIYTYGNFISKIKYDEVRKTTVKNKLILVTSINPTPFGEGKTTVSINLNDSINKLNKKSIVCLRQPSLGPVFGFKGGATGGGKASIEPINDINIHFTGDIHAITSAINLISSIIDNHIYHGNKLNINVNTITWNRALDINDRSLRDVKININKEISYNTSFDITAANELMSIFCLSKNIDDFKKALNNIIIAYDLKNKPIYLEQLNITNAIIAILEKAINPNVVQTKEGNLAFVHGGPFANISFGCSSVIATNTARKISEYTITEAGFGSDLGGEKFLNILAQENKWDISCIVIVITIRALKHHGKIGLQDINKINIDSLENGYKNLMQHIKHLTNYGVPFIVAINKFSNDLQEEINYISDKLSKDKILFAITTGFKDGSKGGINLAKEVIRISKPTKPIFLYQKEEIIKNKIKLVVNKCYGLEKIEYTKEARLKLKQISKFKDYYICISKTQNTLYSDVENKKEKIIITDFILNHGSKIVVVMTNKVFRMPGLPIKPKAECF